MSFLPRSFLADQIACNARAVSRDYPALATRSLLIDARGLEIQSCALEIDPRGLEIASSCAKIDVQSLEIDSHILEIDMRGLEIASNDSENDARTLEINVHALEIDPTTPEMIDLSIKSNLSPQKTSKNNLKHNQNHTNQ